MVKAIDNSHVISLLKEDMGKLKAVKYVKECTNWTLTASKEYVDDINNKLIKQIGTITWFKCEEHKPLLKDDEYVYNDILLYHQRLHIISDGKYYCHPQAEEERFLPRHGNWQPTHWAYINSPD